MKELLIAAIFSVGCSNFPQESASSVHFTSPRAILLNFEFNAAIVLSHTFAAESSIRNNQLLYTIGQLNNIGDITGAGAVGRLDATNITINQTEILGTGKFRVNYKATIPVAWTNTNNVPATYTFKLPLDFSQQGIQSFVNKYRSNCMDLWSGHPGLTADDFWYYYRPNAPTCSLDSADVVTAEAQVSVSPQSTLDRYPEYDMIWKDKEFHAIVLFGRDTVNSTTVSDFGIGQYSQFNYKLRWAGLGATLKSTPENILQAPGAESPDVEWNGEIPDGRKIRINAMLINNPQLTSSAFDERFSQLSQTADLIIYNGHAALGDNVRALSRKGRFVPGQYTIVSMMGCDSFAYVDGYMARQRASLNPDDPNGTKYLDMITNVTPTNPVKLSGASIELIRALIDYENPQTWTQILNRYEDGHYAVVTGEEDNSFSPESRKNKNSLGK